MFGKWLAHYDPIHRGYTPSGIANGVTAMCGWAFPRVRGGYNLYRGTSGAESIDFVHPVGAAGVTSTTIDNFSWRPHADTTQYAYAVRAIGGGGVESAASHPTRVAEFDGAGSLIGLRPNTVVGLSVRASAGGRFVVHWVYVSRFEEATPSEFRIFHDNGGGTVDYNTVVATVAYRRGAAHYSYASGAFAHGTRMIWGVRAATATGVDDGNVAQDAAFADAEAPGAYPGMSLACLAEE